MIDRIAAVILCVAGIAAFWLGYRLGTRIAKYFINRSMGP